MRILVISDSLGFPKPKYGIGSDLTYVGLLSNDSNITHIGAPGSTSEDLLKLCSEKLVTFDGCTHDYVIIQCGIVDCTPRGLPRIICKLLRYLRVEQVLEKAFYKFMNIFGISYTWVDANSFKSNLENLVTLAETIGRQTVIISIAPAGKSLSRKRKKIIEKIEMYNNVIFEISSRYDVNLVTPFQNIESSQLIGFQLPDGHHLSLDGHKLYYEAIKKLI